MDRAEFRQKMIDIAGILGYEVVVKDECFCNMADMSRGQEKIHITHDDYGKKGRISMTGWFPTARDNASFTNESQQITVSEDKSPGQIVKDMKRRLLPEYRAKLAGIITKIKQYEATLDRQESNARKLAEICGQEKYLDDNNWEPENFSFYTGEYSRVTVKTSQSGSVTIEMRGISMEQAEAVLRAITGRRERS